MSRYRTSEVEAEQFIADAWPDGVEAIRFAKADPTSWTGFRIETLAGWVSVAPGDWIITGIQGEKYPIKPDIFAATYEPVG